MMCPMLKISTILLIGLWILQEISVCEFATYNYFTVVKCLSNKNFNLGVLWNVTVKTDIRCATVCSESLDCLAFIYKKHDQRCLGYQYRLNTSLDYEHDQDALYFDKEIDCGYPPKIKYANVDFSLNIARYYCENQNFLVFGRGDPLSYCLPNGNWSINNFTCQVVESCKDVFSCNPAARDGHYIIYPELTNRHSVKVFCHNMSSRPTEYITLYKPNRFVSNYSELTGTCTWKDRNGFKTTTFRKIRMNAKSMVVETDDFIFANLTEKLYLGFKIMQLQPTFGFAADCSSRSTTCPKLGYFIINLEGTGLRLDSNLQWEVFGFRSHVVWFNNGSYAEGRCGGYCGGCKPRGPVQLYIDATQSYDEASVTTMDKCSP